MIRELRMQFPYFCVKGSVPMFFKRSGGSGIQWLVVGLGNPGAKYESTRHNMGFLVVDKLAQNEKLKFNKLRFKAWTATWEVGGEKVLLMKPQTYMNLSGNAVRYWMDKLKLPLENLIVICDDLNLPFGTIRMRKNGSDGGHNGLKDIQARLETTQWARIRIGIGNNFSRGAQVDYVIGELTADEKAAVPEICDRVIEGIKNFSTIGPDRAMNMLNVKPKKDEKGA